MRAQRILKRYGTTGHFGDRDIALGALAKNDSWIYSQSSNDGASLARAELNISDCVRLMIGLAQHETRRLDIGGDCLKDSLGGAIDLLSRP